MSTNPEDPAVLGQTAGSTPDTSMTPPDPTTSALGAQPGSGMPDNAALPANPPDLGSNPVLGTPLSPRERIHPPAVIHALGDAHPGEANPAYVEDPEVGEGGADRTAAALSAREAAEEHWAAPAPGPAVAPGAAGSGVYSYEDSAAGLPRAEQPGGRPIFSGEGEQEPMEYMDAPHGHDTLIGGLESLDQINARVDAKVQANANQIEQAESVSGLNFREGDNYERREFSTPMPERDDVLVGAGSGMSTIDPGPLHTITAQFAGHVEVQAVLQALSDIGIPPTAITVTDPAGDMGNQPAGVAEAVPAGEETVRRSSTELPNDEDLPTTVAAQTATPASGMATMPRAGLARDEGEISRIDAPADAEIYSDRAESDADYRTMADEGAAQAGETLATSQHDSGAGAITIAVEVDRITHSAVRQVLQTHGATAIHD